MVPINHEVHVKADNEKEALELALKAWDENGLNGESEPDWQEARLDIGDNPTPETSGVWIEEKNNE